MTQPRLVQNFSGSRAIICAGECGSIEPLARTLANLGLGIEHRCLAERPIADECPSLNPDRDILFLDGDTDVGATWPNPLPGLLPPVPVIALVGHEAPSRLKALMQCGATAFLHKPVHGAGVYSALFVGVNEHRHRRHLEARLSEHESRRRGRRALIKAIVHLVRQDGMDDETAYEFLRKESMKSRQSVEAFCEAFIRQMGCRESEAFGPKAREARRAES
jgi:AmiR/NasT family two-component response regulator